jgi:hypothetical protein
MTWSDSVGGVFPTPPLPDVATMTFPMALSPFSCNFDMDDAEHADAARGMYFGPLIRVDGSFTSRQLVAQMMAHEELFKCVKFSLAQLTVSRVKYERRSLHDVPAPCQDLIQLPQDNGDRRHPVDDHFHRLAGAFQNNPSARPVRSFPRRRESNPSDTVCHKSQETRCVPMGQKPNSRHIGCSRALVPR